MLTVRRTAMKTDELNKSALRALCRTHGVKNYGKLSNDDMRKALAALERFTDTPPIKKVDTPAAKKPGRKLASDATPSVKAWLQDQIDEHGEVAVEKAKEYVASSGRSSVTLYRQAGELKLKLDR